MELYIIYTEHDMLLSKESYSSWRDIQDRYPDYKASLGPWSGDEVVDYLAEEYSNLKPDAAHQVAALISSAEPVRAISTKEGAAQESEE